MDAPEIFRNLIKMIIRSNKKGFQEKLAEVCDVTPKYFSDFLNNRGAVLAENKRIALVEYLGYEYDEFLSIGKGKPEIDSDGNLRPSKPAQNIKRIYSRSNDSKTATGDMLAHFNNKKAARECVEKLFEIDMINPDKLNSINFIIHAFLEGLRPQKKTGT